MSRHGAWADERGFTLIEVMITIILMGIVSAIAIPTWWSIVESGRVDSATNQLAADLRQAHTTATNRLVPQVVNLTAGSSEYSTTGFPSLDLDDDAASDKVTVDTTVSIAFCPDGSAAEIPPGDPVVCPVGAVGDPTTITVAAADGVPSHTIEVNTVTSRIQIDPLAP